MDHAVVASDISRPVGRLRSSLALQADDGVVEPVLAELPVGGQGSSVEGDLCCVVLCCVLGYVGLG